MLRCGRRLRRFFGGGLWQGARVDDVGDRLMAFGLQTFLHGQTTNRQNTLAARAFAFAEIIGANFFQRRHVIGLSRRGYHHEN